MNSQELYFVRRRGRVEGPWSLDKLLSEVELRKLGRHHELSIDQHDWFRAAKLEGLFEVTSSEKGDEADGAVPKQSSSLAGESAAAIWYYHTGGEQRGPVDSEQLVELAAKGRLVMDDLIWREGMEKWARVEEIPELLPKMWPVQALDEKVDSVTQDTVPLQISDSLALPAMWIAAICVLTSPVPFVGVLGIVPMTMGLLSLSHIRKSYDALEGKPQAILAIVFGLFAVVFSTAIGFWTVLNGYPISFG